MLNKYAVEQIITLYNQGLSSAVIGKMIGSKAQTVTKYLKNAGIEIRGPKKILTEENKQEICELYKQGMSMPKISDKYNVSGIRRILKNNGIKIRSAEAAHRIYPINEDFFDSIDSEEKAYFLGFLYADGCNHKSANFVTLGLEQTDKEILIKLSRLIYKENPEQHVKTQDRTHEGKGITAYITIHSKHICEQLEKLGCMERKTFKIEYPEWLPKNLNRHFIRGYFDGDGSINVNLKKGYSSTFKITSTLQFVKKIDEIIRGDIDVHFCFYKAKNSNVFDVSTSGNRQVVKILNWMYEESEIYLQRKYKKYNDLKLKNEETDELIIAGTRGHSKKKY